VRQKIRNSPRSATSPDDVRGEVEACLAELAPDVEVLLVEVTGLRGSPAVRVFLDRPGGVDHELCVQATRRLRELSRDYAVEVSSPGPSRPLTKPDHFRRFLGRAARIRAKEAIDGRSEFKGELIGADDESVSLGAEWGTVTIPHEKIKRANLVPKPVEVPRRP
jgi:ribosome maturation factor RimP